MQRKKKKKGRKENKNKPMVLLEVRSPDAGNSHKDFSPSWLRWWCFGLLGESSHQVSLRDLGAVRVGGGAVPLPVLVPIPLPVEEGITSLCGH